MSATTTLRKHQTLAAQHEQHASESKEHDFFWTYTEEPHRTRRQAIIKAHPEVIKLCGPEPLTKYLVLLVVLLQLSCAYLLRQTPFFSWRFFLTSYIIGATANQNLFLAIHEISHNLAFKSPTANRFLAVFANLPISIPYSASFRSLGVDGVDVDIPTSYEAFFLSSVLGKAFFCTFQILFYAIRPMFVYQIPITKIHLFNIVVQLAFDAAVYKYVGARALGYLFWSSFLAGSLHPCAGHFIAEHYIFSALRTVVPTGRKLEAPKPEETYSYYGPLNVVCYNVGLHNEHHDFPAIPWTRLPKLREIAHEFYDNLPCHESWAMVMWYFICDNDVGLWARVKRKGSGRVVGGRAAPLAPADQGE